MGTPWLIALEAIDTEHFRLLYRQDRIVKIEAVADFVGLMERVLLADSLVVDARFNRNRPRKRKRAFSFSASKSSLLLFLVLRGDLI